MKIDNKVSFVPAVGELIYRQGCFLRLLSRRALLSLALQRRHTHSIPHAHVI